MRRALVLLLGVVSCASPDAPRVDGVPEDPGITPPILPMPPGPDHSPTPPGTGTVPNGSLQDAGAVASDIPGETSDIGQTPPSTTIPPAATSTPDDSSAASVSSADAEETSATAVTSEVPVGVGGDASAPDFSCEGSLKADSGMPDAGADDAGSVSNGEGECSVF